MKKVLSILFAGVIALMATACFPEENFATFDSSKATAPVIGSYEMGAKALTINYTPGKFNAGFNDKMAVNHMVVLTSIDGKSVNKVIAAANKDNVLTVSVSALSNLFLSMGYQEGQSVSFEAIVRATMQNPAQDNGRNGHVDSKDKVSVNGFEIVIPKGSPYIDYTEDSDWSVIGSLSAYEINWDKDLQMWTDGAGNHVAAHVQLFAGDEFKFRKDQSWSENMGGDFGSLDNVFSVSQDGPNIKVGADGYYDLFVNPDNGTAWISEAFDPYPDYTETSNWSVIGSLSKHGISWDGDIAMITDGTWHVALGVNLAAADEFKFRQDASWTVNMGGDYGGLDSEFAVTQDGPNIKVGADGTFDLFVNPGAGVAKVSETTGAKVSGIIGGDEPEPEPEPITGWNIIGLNGDWSNDILAAQDGNVWTAYITAEGDTEFKWRKDGGWDENYGMEEGATITLGEPFAAAAGGPNIPIAAGFWKVVLDTEALTITISNGDVWSLIGVNGDWEHDIDMVLTDGKWVSPFTAISGEFKLRHNHGWDDNRGGTMEALGTPFAAEAGGANINVEGGNYIVTYDPAAETIVVEKAVRGWNIIGLNGNWSDDITATENNGVWTVRVNVEADTEFKWRKDGGWDQNYGGTFVTLGEPFAAVPGGDNIKLAPGYWLLTLDLSGAEPMLMVSDGTVWSLIGGFNDWSGDVDMVLTDGVWVSPETAISGEFKIRKNHGWDDNRGGTMEALGTPFAAEAGGANINVEAGTYVVTYDPANETITVTNAKKVWSVIGDFTGWSSDVDMEEIAPGIWMSGMIEIAEGGWKVRFDHGWDVNRGGATPTALGQFVAAVPGGDNIGITGTFKVIYNANNETIGTLGWGVVGTINGWNGDMPMNLGSDAKWYSVPVALTTNDEIKIRWNASWDLNRGGELVAVGEAFAGVDGGSNIKVPADGTYMVVYDPEHQTLMLTTAFWGLVGEFNGWGGSSDIFMLFDGAKWCAYNQQITGEWKIRQGSAWDNNRGGTFAEAGTPFTAEPGGPNINLGDKTGFAVIYDPTAETITIQ